MNGRLLLFSGTLGLIPWIKHLFYLLFNDESNDVTFDYIYPVIHDLFIYENRSQITVENVAYVKKLLFSFWCNWADIFIALIRLVNHATF